MKRKAAQRYGVAQSASGDVFLLTERHKAMLAFVKEHPEALYAEVSEATGIPISTLMVYASRMQAASLIERIKMLIGSRLHTVLRAADGVNIDFDVFHI